MELPNLTEERLDDLLEHACKLDIVFRTMSTEYEENELFVIMAIIFAKLLEAYPTEAEKHLKYFRDCMIKKAESISKGNDVKN